MTKMAISGSGWPSSVLLDHRLRASGSPIVQHFTDFHRFFSLFRPPPSPTLANWHGVQKAFSNRRPNRPLRPTSTVEKPLSKRCQMAHTFVSDTGRLATKGSIWCSGTHARIPASYNGYKMRSAERRSEAQLCNIDLFHHLITVMRCALSVRIFPALSSPWPWWPWNIYPGPKAFSARSSAKTISMSAGSAGAMGKRRR